METIDSNGGKSEVTMPAVPIAPPNTRPEGPDARYYVVPIGDLHLMGMLVDFAWMSVPAEQAAEVCDRSKRVVVIVRHAEDKILMYGIVLGAPLAREAIKEVPPKELPPSWHTMTRVCWIRCAETPILDSVKEVLGPMPHTPDTIEWVALPPNIGEKQCDAVDDVSIRVLPVELQSLQKDPSLIHNFRRGVMARPPMPSTAGARDQRVPSRQDNRAFPPRDDSREASHDHKLRRLEGGRPPLSAVDQTNPSPYQQPQQQWTAEDYQRYYNMTPAQYAAWYQQYCAQYYAGQGLPLQRMEVYQGYQ
jgi:hypothetical protein